jgi:hypothetical protein
MLKLQCKAGLSVVAYIMCRLAAVIDRLSIMAGNDLFEEMIGSVSNQLKDDHPRKLFKTFLYAKIAVLQGLGVSPPQKNMVPALHSS